MKIGVIGTGSIASSVVDSLANEGHQITVSQRGKEISQRLAAKYSNVKVADNQTVLDQSQVIFVGLIADVATAILGELKFQADHRIISLMAGATFGEVSRMVAPARLEATMIPFPGIAKGGSPVMAQGKAAIVRDLFGDRNQIFELKSESELAAYMSAQAVLSPAVQMVSDAAQWLGAHAGDATQAEAFLRLLIGSSLQDSDCESLLAALDTPGGFNQRLRQHMQASGMGEDLAQGLNRILHLPE